MPEPAEPQKSLSGFGARDFAERLWPATFPDLADATAEDGVKWTDDTFSAFREAVFDDTNPVGQATRAFAATRWRNFSTGIPTPEEQSEFSHALVEFKEKKLKGLIKSHKAGGPVLILVWQAISEQFNPPPYADEVARDESLHAQASALDRFLRQPIGHRTRQSLDDAAGFLTERLGKHFERFGAIATGYWRSLQADARNEGEWSPEDALHRFLTDNVRSLDRMLPRELRKRLTPFKRALARYDFDSGAFWPWLILNFKWFLHELTKRSTRITGRFLHPDAHQHGQAAGAETAGWDSIEAHPEATTRYWIPTEDEVRFLLRFRTILKELRCSPGTKGRQVTAYCLAKLKEWPYLRIADTFIKNGIYEVERSNADPQGHRGALNRVKADIHRAKRWVEEKFQEVAMEDPCFAAQLEAYLEARNDL